MILYLYSPNEFNILDNQLQRLGHLFYFQTSANWPNHPPTNSSLIKLHFKMSFEVHCNQILPIGEKISCLKKFL